MFGVCVCALILRWYYYVVIFGLGRKRDDECDRPDTRKKNRRLVWNVQVRGDLITISGEGLHRFLVDVCFPYKRRGSEREVERTPKRHVWLTTLEVIELRSRVSFNNKYIIIIRTEPEKYRAL